MKKLEVALGNRSYNIIFENGGRRRFADIFGISHRRAFIVTDDGVPHEYAEAVAESFDQAEIYTVPMGEGSKSIGTFGDILSKMLEAEITRGDVCVAVGGGVVGDLAGFVSSAYMRGIDFYNMPTTLLSMVDSSIGGKTAVNHGGAKNIVGAFYQPKGVLIDTETLRTLSKKNFAGGMAEAIKMATTSDEELFSMLENTTTEELDIETVILRSLMIKKAVVEADEREGGLRKILNFGHTFGHAVEAASEMNELGHGQCVAIGMMAVTQGEVKERLSKILEKFDLPVSYEGDRDTALSLISTDKKRQGNNIDAILVSKIGGCEIRRMSLEEFTELVKKNTGGNI